MFLCFGGKMCVWGVSVKTCFFCDFGMKTCFSVFAEKYVFAILTGKHIFAILAKNCVFGFF